MRKGSCLSFIFMKNLWNYFNIEDCVVVAQISFLLGFISAENNETHFNKMKRLYQFAHRNNAL